MCRIRELRRRYKYNTRFVFENVCVPMSYVVRRYGGVCVYCAHEPLVKKMMENSEHIGTLDFDGPKKMKAENKLRVGDYHTRIFYRLKENKRKNNAI